MTRRLIRALVLAAGGMLTTTPAWAHHSFAAEFDVDKPIKLRGKVTKVEFINPHSWIHLDVTGPDGRLVNWGVEGGSPNALLRLGFTRNSLPAGTEIVVDGYQAKDSSSRAVGKDLTFTDGRRLFLGGSAPGASGEGEEKK
jgi:Family of unknown function (DUF6152)